MMNSKVALYAKAALLLVFTALFANLLQAQSPIPRNYSLDPSKPLHQYILETWGANEGLPTRTLTGLVLAADGYLWIASYNGLYRFDGTSFKPYTSREYPDLQGNLFGYVTENKGYVYSGAGKNGLLAYKAGGIEEIGKADALFQRQVESLLFDGDTVWIGTRGTGLYYMTKGEIKPIKDVPFLRDVNVGAIIKDHKGRIWFGSEGKGLVIREKGIYKVYTTADSLLSDFLSSIYEGPDGKVWIGTNQGVNYFENGAFHVLEGTRGYPTNRMIIDGHGSLWMATRRGIIRLNAFSKELEFLSEEHGLPHRDVSAIVEDREGSIWLATYQAGLARLKDSQFYNFTTRNGLSAKAVATVCALDDERLLLATASGGMHLIDKDKVLPFAPKTDLKDARIKHVMRDSRRRIFISSYGGLLMIEPDGKETMFSMATGLSDNSIRLAYEDSKGNVWIGTRSAGVYRYSPDGEWMNFDKADGLSSNFIMSIKEGPDGDMLIGTNDNGLTRLFPDGKTQKFSLEEGVSGQLVFASHVDKDKRIWLATNAGINLLGKDTVYVFAYGQGMASEVGYDILEDAQGDFWIPSSIGVMKVSKQDLLDIAEGKKEKADCQLFDASEGLAADECVGATQSYILPDGRMCFPTLGGLSIFDPKRSFKNDLAPPVHIDGVRADGHAIDIYIDDLIELPSDVKRLSISYTALSLLAPENVRFKYKLEGYDKDWVEAGNERQAIYTGLPAGEHVFKVIASNNHGVWNEVGASIKLYRKPYFYERLWFFPSLLALALLGGFAFYRIRLAQITQRNQELEDQVAKRTDQITKQKNKLELAYNDLRTVSSIGQEVAALLDVDVIITHTHERVKTLMGADMFGIGIYNKEKNSIEFRNLIRDGVVQPSYAERISDRYYLSVQCFLEKKEIFINDASKEYEDYQKYLKDHNKTEADETQSVIYVPLLIENNAVGVLTVQSKQRDAYLPQHATILQALASYISVAMENSRAYEVIKDNNLKMTDSIRYAQTIQQAVLPSPERIQAGVGEHFVLYKPKDIVSGDFYWFKQVGNMAFLAVVDCTGHGVPGAFMSMIGSALLDEIVGANQIYEPDQILEMLNEDVYRALQQEDSGNVDGMDVSICRFERLHNGHVRLTFAGAKQRIYYVKDGLLDEMKGSTKGIGGRSGKKDFPFEAQTVDLSPNDVVYLFSDGIIDQHGPAGRRLGSPMLKEIFTQLHALPALAQKEALLKALHEHQQSQHQRDDITVLGVRI